MFALLIFLLILSSLVMVHELGHYFAARIFGVKADEFGYGFPPRALGFVRVNGKWKRVPAKDRAEYKETIWSINWLPLGGFVRLKGEQGEDGHAADSFLSKGMFARFCILFAGVLMNWLLAATIFSIGFMVGVPAQTLDIPSGAIVSDQRVQITEVMDGSAAKIASIQPGDFLVKIDGDVIVNVKQAQTDLGEASKTGREILITIEHEKKTVTVRAKPLFIKELNRAGLGVALADTGTVRFAWYRAIFQGFAVTFTYTKMIFSAFGDLIYQLLIKLNVVKEISGPIGIAVLTAKIAQQGWWQIMQFAAMLSLNLAIINILPIPALDGGRMLFVIIEAIRRKKIGMAFEANLHRIGFILLMMLIAVVTAHDLFQYGGVILAGIGRLLRL